MTGPFRVSRRSWEQLGEVFVFSPAGDCYSSAEDGKLRHTVVYRGKHGTACDLLSESSVFFLPFVKEFPVIPPPVIHVGCVPALQTAC